MGCNLLSMHWVRYDQVDKQGSITEEINVNRLSNYEELWVGLGCMVNQLGRREDLGWWLLSGDNERDVVLVGDHHCEYVTLLFRKNSSYFSSPFGFIILPWDNTIAGSFSKDLTLDWIDSFMEGFFFANSPEVDFFLLGVLQGICDHSMGNPHPITRWNVLV